MKLSIHCDAGQAMSEAALRIWYERGQLRTEVERLQAQVAAMQAVVDAARRDHDQLLPRRSRFCRVCQALDALDAAQPEGEPR